jgi:hypothetical protein
MTQTVERRPLNRPQAPAPRAAPRALVPGLTAAAWAAGAGLVAIAVPVLLAWATDSRSGSGAAAATRTAGQLWLLAQGTPLTTPGGVVGLTPLGLMLLPLLLLHRAGRHATRTVGHPRPREAWQLVLAVAAPYALLAAVVAAVCATETIRPDPARALLGGLAVAAVGAGTGVLREAHLLGLAERFPARVRWLASGTAAAVGVLLAGGAMLAGVSLALHASRATSLASATDPGLVGGVALLLLGVLLVPNAAIWGTSWLAGPGFAVGVGTAVGPFGTTLGPVPAFPLLAGLPDGPAPVWLGVAVLTVPLSAGVLAGLLVARRLTCSWALAAAEASAVGPCVGLAIAALAGISGGPLGAHRLAAVGPSPWKVGLAVALEIALPAAVTAAAVVRNRD